MYLNKAFIIGNLTRDPELRSLPSGVKAANFSLATNSVWKDRDGARQESTEYHNVVAFGRQGELVAQYLKKGSQALVEGRIQTRSWEQDGQKKYRTEIVADRVQFGDRRPTTDVGGSGSAATSGADSSSANARGAHNDEAIEYPEDEINPEDIPF